MVKDHVQTAAVGGSMYWRKVKGSWMKKIEPKDSLGTSDLKVMKVTGFSGSIRS
jgi:hypothetical protein